MLLHEYFAESDHSIDQIDHAIWWFFSNLLFRDVLYHHYQQTPNAKSIIPTQFYQFYSNMPMVWIIIVHIKIYLEITYHQCHFLRLWIFVDNRFPGLTKQNWWYQLISRYNHGIDEYPIDILYCNTMMLITNIDTKEYNISILIPS